MENKSLKQLIEEIEKQARELLPWRVDSDAKVKAINLLTNISYLKGIVESGN